ncbi:MAG: type VI secretion system ATPase TssH [Myxococcales bacterium FL481]|nr:MAG: type VI secretion system ATPase TssH [Myxococcales bacterium FL481]
MRVEPKALVRRLNPTCTKMLEAGVGRAASGQYYEIVCEHLLSNLLEPEDGDAVRILRHFDQDPARLRARVAKVLDGLKTGNAGRPVFAESLFQWFEDAWVSASLILGANLLRSGHLLAQLVARGSRYSGEHYPELEAISADELYRQFHEIVDGAPESSHEVADTGDTSPGASPAATGDEALKRFGVSFTEQARAGEIDPIFGRHKEIRQLIDVLARRRKNNPIIVGEPGVGKTALVEGLALAIASGEVPEILANVELIGLDLGALEAGASVKGEFEKRLKAVIAEVKASPKPIVLFIDEAHTLIGAGGSQGNDAANLLKPALARGELRTVAATTWAEFKKYFEKDPALERRFQPVKVDEPDEANATVMLRGIRPTYEKAHAVEILDEAVVAAVELSHRYISGRQLPDKAVDLLDTAAARVKIEQHAKPAALEELDNQIAARRRQLDAIDRDARSGTPTEPHARQELQRELDQIAAQADELTARWHAEREAVQTVVEARQALTAAHAPRPDGEPAPAAQDLAPLQAALDQARDALAKVRGPEALVHAEVDADLVAQVVSSFTGIPAGKMKSSTIDAVLSLEDELGKRVRGQDHGLAVVSETVRMAYAGVRDPNTPIGVLLFVGPSGVGKTETATALADLLYGGERFLTAINMSEFQEKHTVSRLVGSPPGYVGYGEGGVLTEAVRQRPYSVVLLDECEKADLDVMNLFYQVFDKGVLNDGEGRTIDFKNTVVILTSNLASAEIMELHQGDEPPTQEQVIERIRPILSQHFKPALLARMTIVPFGPIGPDIMRMIVEMKVGKLARRLEQSHGMVTEFDPTLIDELTRRCTDADTGARNADHTLRNSLMPVVARQILERMAEGEVPSRLFVGLSPSGDWRLDFD